MCVYLAMWIEQEYIDDYTYVYAQEGREDMTKKKKRKNRWELRADMGKPKTG